MQEKTYRRRSEVTVAEVARRPSVWRKEMDWSMKGERDWMRGEVLDCGVLVCEVVLDCEMVLRLESILSPDTLSLDCSSILFDITFPSSIFADIS